MALKVNSDWLDTEVKLVKTLHGVRFSGYDEENCTADFEPINGEDTIVKVFVEKDGRVGKADLESVKQIVSDYDGVDYGEIIIMAERYTPSAVDYVNGQDSFTIVTPSTKMNLGVVELLSAIRYEKGKLVCPVRCISDNADFHAERGWVRQLRLDFENLVKVEKTGH